MATDPANLCEPANPNPLGEGEKSFTGITTGNTKVGIIEYRSDDGTTKIDTITVGEHSLFAGSKNQVRLDGEESSINPELAAKVHAVVDQANMCNFDPAAKLVNAMVKQASVGKSAECLVC